ncbi:MAG: hypothetical protein R3322_18155 [Kiloniellales bacterium]|nr:hypothetical protein [Kiloniellales bacterium]
MYLPDPLPHDNPERHREILNQQPLASDGNAGLWLLGIVAGAIAVFAVLAAI